MTESTHDGSIESIVRILQAGDAAGAERAAHARLLLQPREVDSLLLRAIALTMLERPGEAIELHRQLIELQPNEPAHHNNLGTALRDAGDLDGAEEAYRQGLSLNARDASALASLGTLRWQRGDAVEARKLLLAAWELDSGLPEARVYGALACHECAEAEMAERLLEGCEQWQYLGPILEADLATALMQLERTDDAEHRLRALLARPEAASVARLSLASQLERVNRLDEAEAILAEASFDPADRNEELLLRATLAARRGCHNEAIPLYREALSGSSRHLSKAPQWFALAKAYDAVEDTEGAMSALATAHELQLKHTGRLVPKLLAADSNPFNITNYPLEAADHDRWLVDPKAPAADKSPIFIVGFPRSGTTLLEQMLDAHPGLRSMDERAFLQKVISKTQVSGKLRYPEDLDQLSGPDLEQLRATYWQHVEDIVRLKPGERLVDKNPLNILRLPMISRIFPNARIVLALRHPCDVILSNYMQSFRAPVFQALCASLQRLSRGYADAMGFWVRHAELCKPAVLEVRYEDLLDDVVGQTRRIAQHLDLSDAAALEKFQSHARAKGFISTPSYAQVVEPLSKKAVGRWNRYRKYLEPVLPALEPAMKRWKYDA